MAKNDNLKDFLTDVADAIREKKGTEDLINPQNFADEIKNLPSGGGADAEKDIRFYDYDGTLLYSYTIEEAQALKELPPLPSHKGLICQEWNWDYDDVIALDRPMNIGANYVTEDGKTRFYITIPDKGSKGIFLNLQNINKNYIYIDWGDGVIENTNLGANFYSFHVYENSGEYIVKVYTNDNNSFGIYGGAFEIYPRYTGVSYLKHIEMGKGVILNAGAFKNIRSIQTISIAKDTVFNGAQHFYNSTSYCLVIPKGTQIFTGCSNNTILKALCMPASLKEMETISNSSALSVTLPNGFEKMVPSSFQLFGSTLINSIWLPDSFEVIPSSCFLNCKGLQNVKLGAKVRSIKDNSFNGCLIKSIMLPNTIEEILGYAFKNCTCLDEISFPELVKRIEVQCCYGCTSLQYIKLPRNLEFIDSAAFAGAGAPYIVDCRDCVQRPQLGSGDVFNASRINKIIVPDALYDEWITATNWTTFSDRIVKSSEYTY